MTVPPSPTPPVSAAVAEAVDRAELGATAPVLLLELLSALGSLGSRAVEITARGRRPFRPDDNWTAWLGRVGFDLHNLADQTGVDLEAAIRRHATSVSEAARPSGGTDEGWPFEAD